MRRTAQPGSTLDRIQRVQPGRLSDKAVALIVNRRAKAVGLDPLDRARSFTPELREAAARVLGYVSASERDRILGYTAEEPPVTH